MTTNLSRESTARAAAAVIHAIRAIVVGQEDEVESLVVAYMAQGHALLEGVPGIGKTLLARSLARALGLGFARVQFTPDLMPTDLIGTNVFDPPSGTFRLVRGPVFTQFLMADEINRTPPKTQSALLEAMQENQVTIDGTSHPLDPDFFVVATNNPIEFEGTYRLPEAQLDRFLLRIEMGLPDKDAEVSVYRAALGPLGSDVPSASVVSAEEARALRGATQFVHVAGELLDYLYRLADAVRRSPHVSLGVSPRGALALLAASRAAALLQGRDYVVPDDMKRFLVPCWAHRIGLSAESELEGETPRQVIEKAAQGVEVPR